VAGSGDGVRQLRGFPCVRLVLHGAAAQPIPDQSAYVLSWGGCVILQDGRVSGMTFVQGVLVYRFFVY
jgi:hypothetical protein